MINVVSAFDGMACAYLALNRANVKVGNYFSIEIDKYARKVAKANFPDIIELGDILKVTKANFGESHIHLLVGGSPC